MVTKFKPDTSGLEPGIHRPLMGGGVDPRVKSRVKPGDDGVWVAWEQNSEEYGRSCDPDVGFSAHPLPPGTFAWAETCGGPCRGGVARWRLGVGLENDGILTTDPKISGRLNIRLLATVRGTHRDGVKPIVREVNVVEQIAYDLRDFLCGSALGVFFLHAASHKFFQI
ncbi:hypothetical protein HJA95_17615 [Rhizobium binae]|uniref:hypothetical protein n=1 Tax=Rhizobium binae TaxID=1138190 RepID=UPI001C83640F|nr:hypothetical protein [Rhizobium binae]MBX4951351.1 hypothetical protein [Rhizobium binae]